MDNIYIGIDNGISGSIAILDQNGNLLKFQPMPVKKCLSYTKAKQWINRIDVELLSEFFQDFYMITLPERMVGCEPQIITPPIATHVCIERPMVNPGRFKATASALRALEATLIVLERFGIAYEYIDSRGWQKLLLPSGLAGPELKTAAVEVAKRKFPTIICKDADALLIAEFCRLKNR